MLKLKDCKVVFAVVGLTGVLLFASPTLALILHLPNGETFSELWMLGPGHMAKDYPFNVKVNETYKFYVGIRNHMGSSAYYTLYVKFKNQTEPSPNTITETPSPIPSLYTYHVFLRDSKDWEASLMFSFSKVSFSENRASVDSLMVNDVAFNVDKSAMWDAESNGYYYQLFVELWIYNAQSQTFQFHNRFVGIRLNITRTM